MARHIGADNLETVADACAKKPGAVEAAPGFSPASSAGNYVATPTALYAAFEATRLLERLGAESSTSVASLLEAREKNFSMLSTCSAYFS